MTPDQLLYIIILVATFLVSTVTLLTGFGIGTVLTPVFAFGYDVKTAVLLVAVVHLANNVLKLGLFRRELDKDILKRFGLISILGAVAGSFLQTVLQSAYVAAALGLFLIAAGAAEFLPSKYSYRFPRRYDLAAGFFSGLMGGMIGNQGAIRSAYLLNYGLSKESFIATATSISIIIDLTRIPVYLYSESARLEEHAGTLGLLILAAFAGILGGRELLKKLSLNRFRLLIAAFLILSGFYLILR